MRSGMTELQWGKMRSCLEQMTKEELRGAIANETIGVRLYEAVYSKKSRPIKLDKVFVAEALTMWSHLAKEI